MKNYAILGKGFIFSRHVQAIQDTGGKVVCTCDIDPSKEADFVDYREMLSSPLMKNIDAFVICTPNHLHAEHARACLHTKKPVLCEKPLTVNTDFTMLYGVNIVLQLRYHPMFEEICDAVKSSPETHVVLRAYRDENFWKCWKGDERKSGGVVYILGAHLFDLLTYALGNNYMILDAKDSMKNSRGVIGFAGGRRVIYNFEFLPSRDGQTRHLEINGKKYILSLKDNLSFEGLHDKVYEAFINGTAPTISDVIPSLELMDNIKKYKG